MKKIMLLTILSAILSVGSSVSATSFDFTGTTPDGGTGSATMDITVSGNLLTLLLRNTSPVAEYNPGITGFGFDLLANLSLTSWELMAYDAQGASVVIGRNNSSGFPWKIGTSMAGVRLDHLATTGNMNNALYNPEATGGYAGNAYFITEAVLTMTFAPLQAPFVSSAFVRLQNVGEEGEGSLKLYGVADEKKIRHNVVPEPGTALLLGAGVAGLLFCRGRRRG